MNNYQLINVFLKTLILVLFNRACFYYWDSLR